MKTLLLASLIATASMQPSFADTNQKGATKEACIKLKNKITAAYEDTAKAPQVGDYYTNGMLHILVMQNTYRAALCNKVRGLREQPMVELLEVITQEK